MRKISVLSAFLLSACLPTPGADVAMNDANAALSTSSAGVTPTMNFGTQAQARGPRGNAALAQDFMELTFNLESGRSLSWMSRFEGPITVHATGSIPDGALTELDRLLGRFRNEAGLNIRETSSPDASITVEFVPRQEIQTTYANVACFVVPRVSGWQEFRSARNSGRLDWASLRVREKASVFVPSDSSAQEIRDCLHEEMAQAMGPLNDLYRLTDSVFNDDNFHTALTGFDMTMLRAYYAPELRAGMTPAEVRGRLPGIFARINPAGQGVGSANGSPTPRIWINTVQKALSGGGSAETSARQAVSFAQSQGWNDGRLAFSYYALGRLQLSRNPSEAMSALTRAGQIYRSLPGGEVHAAHVDMQIAAHALASGDASAAIAVADRAIPVVSRAENAALTATLMLIKAEAMGMQGRDAEAQSLRVDSIGWARYGFGSDAQVRARTAEIAALARRGGKS